MDDPIKNTSTPEAFVTWTDDSSKEKAFASTAENVDHYDLSLIHI